MIIKVLENEINKYIDFYNNKLKDLTPIEYWSQALN
ncbi:IS3 family transposase [Acholeplasma palmae]